MNLKVIISRSRHTTVSSMHDKNRIYEESWINSSLRQPSVRPQDFTLKQQVTAGMLSYYLLL